ncbi:MAG: hypothetical protein ABFD52_05740 [Acidobacteriota bacterium]
MSKVETYSNTAHKCYCQIKLDSGERILLSIASMPSPSIKVFKVKFLGVPVKTVWEYNPTMAGGYEAYVRKLIEMFADPSDEEPKHPLDAIRDRLLPCQSISEVLNSLLEAERSLD